MDKILLAVKYVEGDLSELEHRAFEDAVKYDNELQEYLASYREINLRVGKQLKEVLTFPRFRSAASNTDDEVYVAEKITYSLDYLWFFAWGLVAIIALFIWKPWQPNLYEEFGYSNKLIASKLYSSSYKGFDEAAQYLEKKDPYQAKLIVSKTFMQNPEDFKLASYYAMLLITNNSLETGREVMQPFLQKKSAFKNDAAYILALSYLKAGDIETCKNWLGKIEEDAAQYEQSVQLLNKLNSETTDTSKFNFS